MYAGVQCMQVFNLAGSTVFTDSSISAPKVESNLELRHLLGAFDFIVMNNQLNE